MLSFRALVSVALSILLLTPLLGAAANAQQNSGTLVSGRVINIDGGLPVAGATVELTRGKHVAASGKTAPDGTFHIAEVGPGVYGVEIVAAGYQRTLASDLIVAPGESAVSFQTAIRRISGNGYATIGAVTASRTALATSTTINEHVDASAIVDQNKMRAGDLLTTLPGVTTATSSSVGDDLTVSIRGFNPTETATLLDGHPIGPIGAFGNGFDYQDSPFWGLRSVNVIYGSGATGVYGASTIAGAVDFETLDPTPQFHADLTQGAGNDGKLLTGAWFTGTLGKLGFALAGGVEGTYGMFPPQQITQTGLLGSDVNGNPNVSSANALSPLHTYLFSGNYLLRNDLAKFVYSFDPKTQLSVTGYVATSWDDKSGNGDTDYNSYPYVLSHAQNAINGGGTTINDANGNVLFSCQPGTAGPNGNPSAPGIATITNSGYSCFSAQQTAQQESGPAGGGPGPWQAIRNQDYHARLTHTFGDNLVLVDGFEDNYALDYNRSVATVLSGGFGGFNTNFYRTHGLLLSDTIPLHNHTLALGYYFQHQQETGDSAPGFDEFGNEINAVVPIGEFDLTTASYFLSDQFTPNLRSSVFTTLWLQHSFDTATTNFDPRLSYVYRPSPRDVLRITGGHSYSEPDPVLVSGPPSFSTTPTNLVAQVVCGPGELTGIGSVANPDLKPETADDYEFAYGHRFGLDTNLQFDVYDAFEQNALLNGTLPLSALPNAVPAQLLNGYLTEVGGICHNNPTPADLSVSTTFNAASARYSGIELQLGATLLRGLKVTGGYDVQSASYHGLSDTIQQDNTGLNEGAQISQIPLHKANLGFTYTNRSYLTASVMGHYIGPNNPYNRPGYYFADASASETVGHTTMTLGINNLFNSIAQNYSYIGLGLPQPQNQYGTSFTSLDQGSELFGLPYRQIMLTASYRI